MLQAVIAFLFWVSGSYLPSKMAASAPTFVSDLVQQMKSLTVDTNEETLLDLAVEHVADAAAEKLGLKQGDTIQIDLNHLQDEKCQRFD